MNKKGMDISLNFIILAVLALIALIIVALFFTGAFTNIFTNIEEISITAEKLALVRSRCELYCTTDDKLSWDNPQFAQEYIEAGITNCDSPELELDKNWVDADGDGELECTSGENV